jgi:hypothetical protein
MPSHSTTSVRSTCCYCANSGPGALSAGNSAGLTASMVCAVPKMPPIRYARSGDVNIAYQVTGDDNPIDLVLAPGTTSHLAAPWQYGNTAMIQRLSSFARLIRFDKRGTGMSDRVTDAARSKSAPMTSARSWMRRGRSKPSSWVHRREGRWPVSSRRCIPTAPGL